MSSALPRLLLAALATLPAFAQQGDSDRGAKLIENRSCTLCHTVKGSGGATASDLGRRSARDFTPASLAASFWNHGPRMWQAMSQRNLEVQPLTAGEIADLYTYFHSIRYFDPPGDAGRGKAVFAAKKCAGCHADGKTGPPLVTWPAIANQVRWIEHLWNHSGAMLTALEKKGTPWPIFTVPEMVDLLVYVRNLPNRPAGKPSLVLEDPIAGEKVFARRGCGNCHTVGRQEAGRTDLVAAAESARTMTGLGMRMWNHLPQMRRKAHAAGMDFPKFSENEMSQLLAYLFSQRYFEEKGKSVKGAAVFVSKKCSACHDDPASGTPDLKGNQGRYSAHALAAAVWRHGPRMQAEMTKKGIAWPVLNGPQIADLVAYLNAR